MKKILILLVSILILCLPFSLVAQAVQADAVFGVVGASSYYYTESSVVTEKYYNYDSYFDYNIDLGSDLKLHWNYSSANRIISAIELNFFFPDDSYILGRSYKLSFNTPYFLTTGSNYHYAYIFNNSNVEIINEFLATPDDFDIGSKPLPGNLNSKFLSNVKAVNSSYIPIDSVSGRTDSNTPFTFNIDIPSSFISLNSSITVLIYFFVTNNASINNNYSYLELTNISLEPLGETQFLYSDKAYQENILASSQEINDSINNISSMLFENGEVYAPVPNVGKVDDLIEAESTFVKDHSSDLQNKFDTALNVFDNNGAFAFISNSMQDMVLSHPVLNGVIVFSLAIGLCVLIIGKKL